MTTENTDAAARILTKAIRKLTAQLAEADRMLGISYSAHADTMAELNEERASRGAAERSWLEQSERVVSLDEELSAAHGRIAEMDDRIERALEALRNGLPVRDILTEGFDS